MDYLCGDDDALKGALLCKRVRELIIQEEMDDHEFVVMRDCLFDEEREGKFRQKDKTERCCK